MGVAFWMCELSPTKATDSGAFRRNQLLFGEALTRDRVRKVGRASSGQRALRVLIVNDDQNAADALVGLIGRWGHAAHLAYEGLAALKVAAAQHPDVVLLDIETPLMDGCQIARQLRLDFSRKACFIIAVAEHADEQRRRQCSEAGIDLVLSKPVEPSVVETLLMLEYARVNRSHTDNTVGFARRISSQRVCHKMSGDARNGAAKISRSRLAAGTGSGQQL
jgi:CheY-like chemotaxis protein